MEIFATVANSIDKYFASKAIKDRLLQVLSGKIHSLGNFSVGGLVIPGIFIEGVDIAHNISIENNQLYQTNHQMVFKSYEITVFFAVRVINICLYSNLAFEQN